ncbi:MAG: ribose 5-phosphate isomerase B [Deltaproteobacteria bacterium]|nr:ribose 5-phosphate isomerase B [Deltaproteobacteria bacterium]MBW2071821.1 ribose 5-phosphate isomerase B [Deltaproteobacteria bacterium]
MKIVIGSDHAGFSLKTVLKPYLQELGFSVEDVGCEREQSVDYPQYGKEVARRVSEGEFPRGILICGSGLGMSMVANRFKGVRAALCHDLYSAILSRRHNDANLLVLGGRLIGTDAAKEIVRVWFATDFDGGRHQRRVAQMDDCS